MIKFKIEDLREVSVDELMEKLCVERDDFIDDGVYKNSTYEVKDGVFEVMSREELLDSCNDEEEREEMEDWVYVELDSGVVNCCVFEEYGFDYYRVRV